MSITFRIDPPKLLPWMSAEERRSNVMLLDFEADMEDDQTVRVDLNVVFNPKSIRRGKIQPVDYYVGSTGAEIMVETNDGTICDCTQAVTLNVEYSNTTKAQRKVTLKLTPSVKSKGRTGSITREKAQETSFTATFASEERYLAPVIMGNAVKWTVTMPHGEKAIRDFLIGNLYLFVKCVWGTSPISGNVSVRPSDIRFFDSKRKPISSVRALLMLLVIWERYERIENRAGFQIKFEEES